MSDKIFTIRTSSIGSDRITSSAREALWLDAVWAQLMIDKYLPLVVGTADTDR